MNFAEVVSTGSDLVSTALSPRLSVSLVQGLGLIAQLVLLIHP